MNGAKKMASAANHMPQRVVSLRSRIVGCSPDAQNSVHVPSQIRRPSVTIATAIPASPVRLRPFVRCTMTFCTACASPLTPTVDACPVCGERRAPAPDQRTTTNLSAQRPILIRCLYIAPILLVFAMAGGVVQRYSAEQQWLASAYASAEVAADAG